MLMTENEILSSLSFPSLTTRNETIEAAHNKTFHWALEDPGSTKRPWHNLVEWLRHGHGIYWVNGKLGSGKSTLMKYIYENSKTRKELGLWSEASPVEISGFFFWNSGDEEQKSQSGLLRSLLLQLFQRHRDTLEQVLPDMWSTSYTRARMLLARRDISPTSPSLPPKPEKLTLPRLKQAFHDLVLSLQKRLKLCFFIDGLDEYAGDYFEITEFFQLHANLPGVKFCISSRPLLVFEQAFRGLPGLRLQDLSKKDIKNYVKSQLYSHGYMKQLVKRNPDESSRLVASIVQKARGVFLWVKLVTRSLLRGLSDYNRISDLKKRVSQLPSDLEALYQHILDNLDPFYRIQMSQIFQIFRAAQNRSPGLVTLLNLSWADEDEDLLVEIAPIQPYTRKEIEERCEIMDGRLKSVCAGLLEATDPKFSSLQPDCHVLYLHRTVSDWLTKPGVWENLTSITTGTDFSPNLAMLKSRIMKLKTLQQLDLNIAVDALKYARDAEHDLQRGFPKLVDQVDIATEFHWRKTRGTDSYWQPDSLLSSSSNSDSSNDTWHSLPDHPDEEHSTTRRSPENPREVHSVWGDIPRPTFERSSLHEARDDFEDLLQKRHWSQAIVVPGVATSGEHKTFFDLARSFGLTHYVDAKYDGGHAFVEHEVSHWLLMQAFSGTCGSATTSNRPKDPNPEQVERILASGIDPNMTFDGGMTPWQGALLDAFWHVSRGPSPPDDSRIWRQKAQAWGRILEHFLDHRSDPDCPPVRLKHLHGFPRVTPLALVEVYSLNSLAEEAARLERCIAAEMARRDTPRTKKSLPTPVTRSSEATSRTVGQRSRGDGGWDDVEPRGIIQWLFSWKAIHRS